VSPTTSAATLESSGRDGGLCAQEVVAGNREIAFNIELLGYVSEPRPGRPSNCARVRNCADQGPKQDAFAGAVWADYRERGSLFDAETQFVDHFGLPEADGKLFDLQCVHRGAILQQQGHRGNYAIGPGGRGPWVRVELRIGMLRRPFVIVALAAGGLVCSGCSMLAGLFPAAAGLAGSVVSGAAQTSMGVAELAHKPVPVDDAHKNESAAAREERCDSLQLAPPDVVEIRKNGSGGPEYRELSLKGAFLDAHWVAASDAPDGGWRPAVNFLRMEFDPPLDKSLPADGSGYLAYAIANYVTTEDEDRLTALSEDFGGPIGIFKWNGTVYRYALARVLPCFQPPG